MPSPYPNEEAKYEKAKAVTLEQRRVSISIVQRTLGVGFNEACHYIERMERDGMVSKMLRNGERTIL